MIASPFFSIVIPVFNRAHAVAGAIDSILAQESTDYEVIVVDDGSTDETAEIVGQYVRQYAARGVTLIRNERNLGVGPTRNTGVRAARGQWVMFLDSDNRLKAGGIEALRKTIALCDDKVAVVHGKSELIGVSRRAGSTEAPQRWNYRQFLGAARIDEALAVTRREVLLRFPFEESLAMRRECGSLVWYAIGRAGYDYVWTQEVVQHYQISSDSLSGTPYLAAHPEEMVACNQKILAQFGADLSLFNKQKLIALEQKTAFYCIMAARRSCALRHARMAWALDRTNLRTLLLMTMCWIGPRTARRLYSRVAAANA